MVNSSNKNNKNIPFILETQISNKINYINLIIHTVAYLTEGKNVITPLPEMFLK